MNEYTFTMQVTVSDEEALFRAALDAAINKDHLLHDHAVAILKPDGEVDPCVCIQTLADPGPSWPGTEIVHSVCE